MTRHLSTNPGKRVRLVLHDGGRLDGHFVRRDDSLIWIELPSGEVVKLKCAKVRTMIVNPQESSH